MSEEIPTDVPTDTPTLTDPETLGTRVDLPSGGWALIRDIDANPIRVKERKALMAAMNSLEGSDTLTVGSGTMETVLILVVRQWSYSADLGRVRTALLMPSARPEFLRETIRDLTALVGELTVADYDALLPYVEPAMKATFPTFGATPATIADPKAPTEPLPGSNGHSEAGALTAVTLSPTSTAT